MTELDKLEKYLKDNGYKYRRIDEDNPIETAFGMRNYDRHQLIVEDEEGKYMWDAICHFGSYGHEQGLIEVMGEWLIGHGDVEGWLTADDVIDRIERRKDG